MYEFFNLVHLKMSSFHLYFWRMLLFNIEIFVDRFFSQQCKDIPSFFRLHSFYQQSVITTVSLYIMHCFISFCFQGFLFSFWFQKFDYDVQRYNFLFCLGIWCVSWMCTLVFFTLKHEIFFTFISSCIISIPFTLSSYLGILITRISFPIVHTALRLFTFLHLFFSWFLRMNNFY